MTSTKKYVMYRLIDRWRTTILCILGVLLASSSFAQGVAIKASIDSSSILIGDQTTIHLEISHPADISLHVVPYNDTLVSGIEILLQNDFDTSVTEGNRVFMKKDFLITSFDSGNYIIPPFEASISDTAVSATFRSNPLFLEVLRPGIQPADSTQQIFDIKLPYRAPITFREILPYLLGGLALIGLLFFLIMFIRKRERDEPVIRKVKPVEPAHVIALRELDKLKSEKIWQKDKIKLYYSRLTEILRIYIENRYGILAMEQTSNETLQSLLEIGFNDNNLFDKLKEILYLADMAKFAKAKPLASENETAMLSSYIFVNETKQAWKKGNGENKGDNTDENNVNETITDSKIIEG